MQGGWLACLRVAEFFTRARHQTPCSRLSLLLTNHLPCTNVCCRYNSLITALAQGEQPGLCNAHLVVLPQLVDGLPAGKASCILPTLSAVPQTVARPPSCPAGAQWQKASEVFDQMLTQGCNPDVVT